MKLLPKSLLEIKAEMKILNILVFAVAFILVTGGMIFLNSIYSNIFKFNFSPISSKDTVAVSSTVSQNDPTTEINKQLEKKAEPVESKDSSKINLVTDSVVSPPPKLNATPQVIPAVNKVNNIQDIKETTIKQNRPKQIVEEKAASAPKNENEIIISNNFTKSDVDTIYQKWIKQTAKLYESMDPKKAALIIRNYSETTARDIIYKMKKNKAAEVLSELDPVTANKIARFPGDKQIQSSINN